jgi:hypothetical protein
MKAIVTKYIPCTNTKPSRIKATDTEHNSIIVSYNDDSDTEHAHMAAALALCKKMNWPDTIIGGGTKTGYVFVFANSTPRNNC